MNAVPMSTIVTWPRCALTPQEASRAPADQATQGLEQAVKMSTNAPSAHTTATQMRCALIQSAALHALAKPVTWEQARIVLKTSASPARTTATSTLYAQICRV